MNIINEYDVCDFSTEKEGLSTAALKNLLGTKEEYALQMAKLTPKVNYIRTIKKECTTLNRNVDSSFRYNTNNKRSNAESVLTGPKSSLYHILPKSSVDIESFGLSKYLLATNKNLDSKVNSSSENNQFLTNSNVLLSNEIYSMDESPDIPLKNTGITIENNFTCDIISVDETYDNQSTFIFSLLDRV